MDTILLERCALALGDVLPQDKGFILIVVEPTGKERNQMISDGTLVASARVLADALLGTYPNGDQATYVDEATMKARKTL